MSRREMLPDLPLWMWLAVAVVPVVGVGLMIPLYIWGIRALRRHVAKRTAMFDAYFRSRGSRCSDDDAACRRIEAALTDSLGGSTFSVYWVAAAGAGTVFEYGAGVGRDKHGYGYLERSPVGGLEETLTVCPKTKLTLEYNPVYYLGRRVREGWASPEFHRRFDVAAPDAAVASRVVTFRLQSLLLELPEVSRLDREIVEFAINKDYLAVLCRKGDWSAKHGDPLPELENHLRLAVRIRDALGR